LKRPRNPEALLDKSEVSKAAIVIALIQQEKLRVDQFEFVTNLAIRIATTNLSV
jgi:hypothetical protein